MYDRSEIMKRIPMVHKDDRTLELVNALGLSRTEWTAALYMRSLLLDEGCTRRSPHCLFVDCIYLIAKAVNKHIKQKTMYDTTKQLWGIGTEPRPSAWHKEYKDVVQRVVDILVRDK